MNDRQGASLILMAGGIFLTAYWYRLSREQRDSLLAGITGKRATRGQGASKGADSGAKGPIVGPPRPGPPAEKPTLEDRFNRVLEEAKESFRRMGIKPPYEIKPLPRRQR